MCIQVANIFDAELFYVSHSGSDPTLLEIHNKEDICLTPTILAQNNKKNILATKNHITTFGVTHLNNFDLLGRWVADSETYGFKHSTKPTWREVIKYVTVKEVEEEEVEDGRGHVCIPYIREKVRESVPMVSDEPGTLDEKPLPQ